MTYFTNIVVGGGGCDDDKIKTISFATQTHIVKEKQNNKNSCLFLLLLLFETKLN